MTVLHIVYEGGYTALFGVEILGDCGRGIYDPVLFFGFYRRLRRAALDAMYGGSRFSDVLLFTREL